MVTVPDRPSAASARRGDAPPAVPATRAASSTMMPALCRVFMNASMRCGHYRSPAHDEPGRGNRLPVEHQHAAVGAGRKRGQDGPAAGAVGRRVMHGAAVLVALAMRLVDDNLVARGVPGVVPAEEEIDHGGAAR